MPIMFDSMTPVLDFQAAIPKGAKHKRWLLWPALAYKVLLPQRRASPLNLFQLVVLRLCVAGVRTPAQIEARLALPQELIVVVLDQLRGRRLVDDAGCPSPRGMGLLADEDAPQPAPESGYVLVDAHGQTLWPHLHRGSLPFVDVEPEGQAERVTFTRGSVGNGHTVHARPIRPSGAINPVRPSARELQRAAQRHARRLRDFAGQRPNVATNQAAQALMQGERVTLLATAPEPVYVAVCLFHQADSAQQAWMVTDPCGFGDGRLVREEILRMAREGRFGLDHDLQRLSGDAWHVDQGELAHVLLQGRQQAMQRVLRRCGDAAQQLPPNVLERLFDADRRLLKAHNSAVGTTSKIENFIAVAYEAVEHWLDWLVQLYRDPSLLSALKPDAQPNIALLAALAEEIGLQVSPEVTSLLAVKRSAVKGVICNGNRTLQPSLAACLLAAKVEPRHPLRVLAARVPGMLGFLARLRQARNSGSHDGSALPTLAQAQELNEELYAMLRGLFGAAAGEATPAQKELQQATDVYLRMRARAEQDAMSSPGIEAYPDLFIRMVEMHEAAIEARTLAGGNAEATAVAASVRDLSVRACIALEAALREVERGVREGPLVAGLSHYDRKANAALAVAAARGIGFALDPAGGLPQALTHAQPSRVQSAARRGSTLSARLMNLLLGAAGPAEPLRALAQECPSWLLDVGEVIDLRGHGDREDLEAGHIEQLETQAIKAVQAVLNVLN